MDTDQKNKILDRDKTIWIAVLSDGTEVWQDIPMEQDREEERYSSWQTLKKEISQPIIGMKIKFRSHIEELPSNADGYFFSRGIIATFPNVDQDHCYVMGYVLNGLLFKIWYKIPELIEYDAQILDIWDPNDKGLILNAQISNGKVSLPLNV